MLYKAVTPNVEALALSRAAACSVARNTIGSAVNKHVGVSSQSSETEPRETCATVALRQARGEISADTLWDTLGTDRGSWEVPS